VEVRHIDPADDAALAAWSAVLQASDRDLWPDEVGYTLTDTRAVARFRGRSWRWELFAAAERAGPMLGVGSMEFSQRDNLHAVEIIVAVHPEYRRRGVGTAVVEHLSEVARADGRRTLNSLVDVPVAKSPTHASRFFAPKVGFESTMAGHSRHLSLPADKARIDELRGVVARARDAADYRVLTFEAPWPDELMEDQGTLLKVMSTDEPAGDGERQEETWDPERIHEVDELLAAREVRKLAAVAQHVPSGRIVAFSEILLADDTPDQCWQLITVVHPAHRGHRLGLAVKIANLDVLTERAPAVRFIRTGNAAVNAPMIAVNDMMGFEIVGEGQFWQKHLTTPA
jgi:GNAT superfamily N-acetyltransferase